MDFELDRFVFERVLNEGEPSLLNKQLSVHPQHHLDPTAHSVVLLGTLRPSSASSDTPDGQAKTAIVRIERTALPSFSEGLIARTKPVESTDIVSSSFTTTH
jgi:m7GpppX diphosphatase